MACSAILIVGGAHDPLIPFSAGQNSALDPSNVRQAMTAHD